jgi:signal transduction histidine kinase
VQSRFGYPGGIPATHDPVKGRASRTGPSTIGAVWALNANPTRNQEMTGDGATATAAVSGLCSADLDLTAADRDELLATAGRSLDLMSGLADSLLDVTRLQAGTRSVFPHPADLEDIIASALSALGPAAGGAAGRRPRTGRSGR